MAASDSTQYVIDHYEPKFSSILERGDIERRINRFDVLAVERAVTYNIHEAMGDSLALLSVLGANRLPNLHKVTAEERSGCGG